MSWSHCKLYIRHVYGLSDMKAHRGIVLLVLSSILSPKTDYACAFNKVIGAFVLIKCLFAFIASKILSCSAIHKQ